MKKIVGIVFTSLAAVAIAIAGICSGFELTPLQSETLKTVSIIAGIAAAYCFIVGEISRNNSQMDKIWSITPEIYLWVIAAKGGFDLRLVTMAILATIWGIRLTINFGRKGAYSIKFWSGEEDYRWVVLRNKKILSNKYVWALFDLFFISIYQNFAVLAITFPAIVSMESKEPFGFIDIIALVLTLGFIVLETVADEQQWRFHSEKKRLMAGGKKLEEIPFPYSRGFNTTGLWSCARHPNYLGEQCIWISLYIFSIGAGVIGKYFFNWTVAGAMLLVLLFQGSSVFGEAVSSSKYKEYPDYCRKISKFIPVPWKKY